MANEFDINNIPEEYREEALKLRAELVLKFEHPPTFMFDVYGMPTGTWANPYIKSRVWKVEINSPEHGYSQRHYASFDSMAKKLREMA